MGRRKKADPPSLSRTNEALENEIIAMAYNLARQKIADGTASSSIITHFLALGSSKARLERELLQEKTKLMTAKTDSIERQEDLGLLYKKAMAAMKRYNGDFESSEEYDDYPEEY